MCVTLYIQDSTLADVKIEMQKITDKQFILLVFIHTIFKMDFYQTKIERKFCENEVENFLKVHPSKFAKILNENEHFIYLLFYPVF